MKKLNSTQHTAHRENLEQRANSLLSDFILAAKSNSADQMTNLIQQATKLDLRSTDNNGNTPLTIAIIAGTKHASK